MCISPTGSAAGIPTTPVVAPPPTRESVTSPTISPEAKAATALALNKKLVEKRQGVFGNIRTQPMGDATYGGSTFAAFGRRAA